MAGSALKIIQEESRRAATGDFKFVQKLLYFFELQVPRSAAAGTSGSYFFPLVLNPKSYKLTEPFALERTFTQGAGMYVEEHGIIERVITLQGTTGFKPRRLARNPIQLLATKPENKSFSRNLDSLVFDKISGHRHFQYLQDAVFRTYADLKRDPATAKDTQLLFHNPKDDEVWHVAPRNFDLDRSSDKPVSYEYSIELLVLGPGTQVEEDFSEDKKLLDQIKDSIQDLKNTIAKVSGAINDLTAVIAEIEGIFKGLASAVDEIRNILVATTNFVNGVTDFIEAPYAIINSVQEVLEAGQEAREALEEFPNPQPFPSNVTQTIRTLQDGLDKLGEHPEAFEVPSASTVRQLKDSQELLRSASGEAIAEAEQRTPPATLDEFNDLGTQMTPGEVESAGGDTTAGRDQPNYTGAQNYELTSGDTLVSLAAKFLGDARLWQQIAIINGLKPPFVNDQAGSDLTSLTDSPLPGVVGVGRKILIPNFSKPPVSLPLLPVLGVRREAPAEEHFLGADFELIPITKNSGRTTYDIVIDKDGGSVDAKLVRGVPNLVQALKIRLATERGSDILYRTLGVGRVVSLNTTIVGLELAKFRVLEALKADPRVSAVRRLNFGISNETEDAVEMEADIEVRGFTQTSNVKSILNT